MLWGGSCHGLVWHAQLGQHARLTWISATDWPNTTHLASKNEYAVQHHWVKSQASSIGCEQKLSQNLFSSLSSTMHSRWLQTRLVNYISECLWLLTTSAPEALTAAFACLTSFFCWAKEAPQPYFLLACSQIKECRLLWQNLVHMLGLLGDCCCFPWLMISRDWDLLDCFVEVLEFCDKEGPEENHLSRIGKTI